MNRRVYYGIIWVALVVIEILIACFVHDAWIRPYGGDILVVGVIYFFIRMVYPKKIPYLALGVFIFAVGVECLQGMDIVTRLGLEDYTFFRVLIGTTFSWLDIVCYAIGGVLLAIYGRCEKGSCYKI